MVTGKQFALFTLMEVVYDNGRSKGAGKDNGNYNSGTKCSGNENCNNGGKVKGMMRGLRMVKHKSKRYMFNMQQSIDVVL